MKKKSGNLKSTVFFDDTFSIHSDNAKKSGTSISRCLTLMLCVFSALFTLQSTIDMPINLSIIAYVVSFCIIFTLISNLKEHKIIIKIALIGLFGVLCFITRSDVVYGLKIIRTNFLTTYNQYYYTNFLTYPVNNLFIKDYEAAKATIITLFSYLFCGYFAYALKEGKGFLSYLLFFAFPFWGAVNLVAEPCVLPITLMLFSLIAIGSLQSRFPNQKSEGKFVTKYANNLKLHRYYGGNLTAMSLNRNWISGIALTTSLLLLIMVISPKESYQPDKRLETIQANPLKFFQDTFEDITVEEFALNMPRSGIGGGDLTAIDRKDFFYETHLYVTMEEEEPMLLKGYVGSVYENDRWNDLDETIYNENADVFTNLAYYDISPHTLMKPLYDVLREEYPNFLNIEKNLMMDNPITIKNVKANRNYAYVPNILINIPTDQSAFVRDTIVDGWDLGRQEYTIQSKLFPRLIGGSPLSDIDSYDSLIQPDLNEAISEYEKFVYDHYLTLPNDSLQKLKDDFPLTNWDGKQENLVEPVDRVKSYLTDHAVYDLSPGKKPQDKDYIEYFLYENHKGYCSHFATAATMMFRSMGIPARYVEGYTITDYDISFNRTGRDEIDIMDSNAHAWTEVYVPIYGWVAVDVTPGFSSLTIAEPVHDAAVPEEIESSTTSSEPVNSSEISSEASASSVISSSTSNTVASEESDKELDKSVLVFLVFLGVILIFLGTLALKNVVVTSRRKSKLSQANQNHAVISGYTYLTEILSFLGYDKLPHETEQEFAKRATAECDLLQDDTFIALTELSLKAKFSDHIILPMELNQITDYSQKLSNHVFESLKITEKLKYQFMDNLK